jgi:plastocyanin
MAPAAVIRLPADRAGTYMRRHAIFAALLGAALLAGCGGDEGAKGGDDAGGGRPAAAAKTAAKRTDTIKIKDFVYSPTPATVIAGQRISIRNADAAPHTITDAGSGSGSGSGKAFDSGTIKAKATGSVTIDRPGTYRYICEFHPFMKGEITVTK